MVTSPFLGFWSTLERPFSVLAPMENVTDWVFRSLINRAGRPDVFFTEFTSAAGLARNKKDSLARLGLPDRSQNPVVAQIWGTDPEDFYRASLTVRRLGFAGIDVNMGCPQRKITKKGACSALIKNPSLAREIVLACLEATDGPAGEAPRLPVSVKTRLGWKSVETEAWLGLLLELPIAALTVHGRTAEQQSEGSADWSEIARASSLRKSVNPDVVFIGNGDILTAEQALDYGEKYDCDGLMVGRGIFSNPYLFRNFRLLSRGNREKTPSGSGKIFLVSEPAGRALSEDGRISFELLGKEVKLAWARSHLDFFEAYWNKRRNFEILKKYFKIYLSGDRDLEALREALNATHGYEEARALLRPEDFGLYENPS